MEEFPRDADYTFSIFDPSLEALALRCNSSVDEIYTRSQSISALRMPKADFIKAVKPGVVIKIPLDPTEQWWRWPVVPVAAGRRLAALVAEKNKDPRRYGLEPLTAKYLWFHALNGKFRDHHLRAHMLLKDELERAPENLLIKAPSPPLRVPYPFRVLAGWVNGAPQGLRHGPLPPAPTPTVAIPPPDLFFIMNFRNRLETAAKKLRIMNELVFNTFQRNAKACYRLDAAELVCSLVYKVATAGSTPSPKAVEIDGVRKKLNDLRKLAAEVLLKDPISVVHPPSFEKDREELGRSLLKELRAEHIVLNIKGSMPELLKEKNKVLFDSLCNVVEETCFQLTQSPVAEEALKDIEEAVAFLGGIGHPIDLDKLETIDAKLAAEIKKTPTAPEPLTVLGALLAPIAQPAAFITGLGLSLVGNLPGPPSLAVAVITLAGIKHMPNVASLLANPASAPRGPAARYVAAALKTFRTTAPPQSAKTAYGEWLKDRAVLIEAIMGDKKKQEAAVNMLVRRTNDGFQGSPKWTRGLTVIAVLGFIVTCVGDDPNKLRKAVNVVGSGSSATGGLLASFARYRAVAPTLAKTLGWIGAICTFVSGVISTWESYKLNDTNGTVAAGANAGGSLFILVGSAMVEVGGLTAWTGWGAGLAIAGLALVIASSVYTTLRDSTTSGSQLVVCAQVNQFGVEADEYLSKRADLKSAFEAAQKAMYDADFMFNIVPSERAQLARIGFGDAELDMMTGVG